MRPLVSCVAKGSRHALRAVPFPLISSRLVRCFTSQNSFQSHRLNGVGLACSASRSLSFQFVIHEQTTLAHSNLYPKVRDSVKYTALRKFVGSMRKRLLSVSDRTGIVSVLPFPCSTPSERGRRYDAVPKGRLGWSRLVLLCFWFGRPQVVAYRKSWDNVIATRGNVREQHPSPTRSVSKDPPLVCTCC